MATYDEIVLVCEQPIRIGDNRGDVPQFVPCRNKCKKCKDGRQTDYAGRAFAESLTATQTVALSLTYNSRQGVKSQHLHYPDIQRMLYRLRSDGFKVRYLVAGEYGTLKGRAHWHCVLYFYGAAPDLPPEDTKFQTWKYWANEGAKEPLGYVFLQRPTYYGVRYVVKYAVKDEGKGKSTRKVQCSLKPPLGALYWQRLARDEIKAGKPFSFQYYLPDCRFKNGNPIPFYATGASALLKWKAFIAEQNKVDNTRLPMIDPVAYPALTKMLIKAELRQYCASKKRDIKLNKRMGGYIKSKRFGDTALLKMDNGAVIGIKYHGPDKELSLWLVRSLREMVAVGRRKVVLRAKQLPFGVVPF